VQSHLGDLTGGYGNVTKGRLRGGEAADDGVADVVEAGLSQLTVAAVVSFDSTELPSTRTDSLNRFFFASAP